MARYVDIEPVMKSIQQLRGCTCSCSDGIIDDVEMMMDMAPDADVVPILEEATNGNMFMTMFPDAEVVEVKYFDRIVSHYKVSFGKINGNQNIVNFKSDWWDAPFKVEGKE